MSEKERPGASVRDAELIVDACRSSTFWVHRDGADFRTRYHRIESRLGRPRSAVLDPLLVAPPAGSIDETVACP